MDHHVPFLGCRFVRFVLLPVLIALPPLASLAPARAAVTYTEVHRWGSQGHENGQFQAIGGLATDQSCNVYVTDSSLNRVQKLSSGGAFLTRWGSPGTGNGQFNGPRSVAVDGAGNVYVWDSGNKRIQEFTNSGATLLSGVAQAAPSSRRGRTGALTWASATEPRSTDTMLTAFPVVRWT